MNTMMLVVPIVFIVILLFLFIAFMIITSKQEKDLKTMDKSGKVKRDTPAQTKAATTKKTAATASPNTKEQYKKEDVFKFMEFDSILDKMIVQNGGSRFTMAIRCKGINYDLMSEMEQLSVEEGFITFLNTLKYPIQLYVQAQNIDLKGNIVKYKNNITELTNDYNNINEEYNKLASAFDADERELDRVGKERDRISNVYEYAHDIIKYVEKMSTNKNLLQRNFYILVSYNTSEINAVSKFNKDEIIDMCSTELSTRCKGIISALSSCSVSGQVLSSDELADLLYSAYNRDDKSVMSVREAVDAGMLRLYSTSEDAFQRKEAQLDEYLRNQAKLKAYQAIKYAKEHDEIETEASKVLAEEEEIARRATNYIKNSSFPEDEKDRATQKILADYREDKKTLQDIDEIQKEKIIEQAEKDIEKIPELEKMEVPSGVQLIEKSKTMSPDEEVVEEQPQQGAQAEQPQIQQVQQPQQVQQSVNTEQVESSQNLYNEEQVEPVQPVQQPVQQTPVAEQPVQQPVQQPFTPAYEQPTQQPVQQPVQQPFTPAYEQPTQQPVEQPTQSNLYEDDDDETIM